jgi:competence protein ComEA
MNYARRGNGGQYLLRGCRDMSPATRTPTPAHSRALLRRVDQAIVALLVLAGLVSTAVWWLAHGGASGNLVELERADPRTVRFEVDVNTAEWPELVQLPAIGETLAKRIVDSRLKDGPFRDHKDLLRVRGIGPKTFDTIKPYLRPMPDQEAVAQK